MQTEPKNVEPQMNAGATRCPNCHNTMPLGLRFCRACGFRLGEGVAEYAETMRFPNAMPGAAAAGIGERGALAYDAASQLPQTKKRRNRKRSDRFIWLMIICVVAAIAVGSLLISFNVMDPDIEIVRVSRESRSYFGSSDFKKAEGGVTFDKVTPPGSPADKAGLIGGDTITSFDGQSVKSVNDMMKLLAVTPIGKTVAVTYIRDGEPKTANLTTISKDEWERLDKQWDRRKDKGFLGIDDDVDRVPVLGTKIYGARVDVHRNRPAYLAGMRDGDIVIEFDGIPIRTGDEFLSRIDRAVPDSIVTVVVMRGSERLEIPVKMGVD